MYGERNGDNNLFDGEFSDDSLGESTRSLLSPIYSESFSRLDLSEGSLSGDEDIQNEKLVQFKEEGNSADRRKATSLSPHTRSVSRNSKTTKSSSTEFKKPRSSYSSKLLSSRTAFENRNVDGARKDDDGGSCLSPWENWLVRKTAQNRETEKLKILEKKKEREECERKRQEKEELIKVAREKYKEWVERKTKIITDERRKKKQQDILEKDKKESLNRSTQEKALVKYNNWVEEKKERRMEERRKQQLDARMRKDKEVERRLKSEEAYRDWIKKVKEKPQPMFNSFAYTGGLLTGCYEWGLYPLPSYCNPIPWVPPKVKQNNRKGKVKAEIQPPSPPLLFKERENKKTTATNRNK